MKKISSILVCILLLLVLFRVFFYERKIVKCGSSRCVVSINKITGNAEEKVVSSYRTKHSMHKPSKKEIQERQVYYENHCHNGKSSLKCRLYKKHLDN